MSAIPLTTYAEFVADAVAAMGEVLHQLGDKKINRRGSEASFLPIGGRER